MAAQRQASSASQTPHLSPAELSYLYTSLALPNAPIRPDGRSPTQFRPLMAETNVLPAANGSARIGFADGTQAIVGIKAEVEKTASAEDIRQLADHVRFVEDEAAKQGRTAGPMVGQGSWVQMSIEIPGFRDDDALPVFLAEMMREPLVGSAAGGAEVGLAGDLKGRLVINKRWHWRLYIDVLLLSQPLSYPLPLLSLTTHLALLSTKLPKLRSYGEEDPFFDDDWDAAEYLYPRDGSAQQTRPPITLLVISVGENIIFDPSREEISVADTVMAISVSRDGSGAGVGADNGLKALSIRTIDPPSRLTQPGVSDSENVATLGPATGAQDGIMGPPMGEEMSGVWKPRRGGVKRNTIARMVKMVIEKGGIGEEVLEGLDSVEVG